MSQKHAGNHEDTKSTKQKRKLERMKTVGFDVCFFFPLRVFVVKGFGQPIRSSAKFALLFDA
jgi:hypothetical protein